MKAWVTENSNGVSRVWLLAVLVAGVSVAGCKETPAQLKSRAERGDLEAMVALANAYQEGGYEGEPMPYWPEEAVRLYRLAANQKYPEAMKKYGWCLWSGTGIPHERWEGLRWLWQGYQEEFRERKKSVNQLEEESGAGVAKSQYRLALILRDGLGLDPDPSRALGLLEEAARQNYADSRYQLSKLKSEWTKFQEAKNSARRGDVQAMIRYADYLEGQGWAPLKVRRDEAQALKFLEESSRKSPEGQVALARYLLRKDPVDGARARNLYQKASRAGYRPAMEFIAGLHENARSGAGPELFSKVESFQVCEQLARAGVRSAQVILAKKYLFGQGTQRAPVRAIPWLKSAAVPSEKESGLAGIFLAGLLGPDRGDAEAQFLLGCCYREGWGVARSSSEAMHWFLISSGNGHEEAKGALASMRMAGN